MKMYTLYYAPGACSLASHITLEEIGADFERRRVDFSTTEQQSDEYLSLNPKARVPTLITPHGSLTETPAILAYLAQSHPDATLAPLDSPFAMVRISPTRFQCSEVNIFPVRPKPLITSSVINNTPWRSQISRRRGQ